MGEPALPGGGGRPAARFQPPGHQEQQRRIGGQHVVRQLGRQDLAEDPPGNVPGEHEGKPRVGAEAVQRRKATLQRHGAEGPQHQRIGQEIVAGREAVRFLSGNGLAQHVPADRFLPEAPADLERDGDDPGRGDERHDGDAGERLESAQPAPVAAEEPEREDGQQAHQEDDRSLDEEGRALRDPEQPEGGARRRSRQTRRDVDVGQRALREEGGGKQRGVGLGDAALESEAEDAGECDAGDPAGALTEQGAADGEDGADRDDAGKDRDQPVDPGRGVGAHAGGFDDRALQPVDADRLLVAADVLEADVDIVAAVDHLARGLHVARLVAVDRRQRGNAGQERREREQDKQRVGPHRRNGHGRNASSVSRR